MYKEDTLPKLLRKNHEELPNTIAERYKKYGIWNAYSWGKVYENVKYFCLGLMKLGFQRGDTVALIGENEPELYWGELAVLAGGGIAVCLYSDSTSEEIEYIIKDSRGKFVIAEDQEQVDKLLDIIDGLKLVKKIVYWDEKGLWNYDNSILMSFESVSDLGRTHDKENPNLFGVSIDSGKASDIAVLCYTSGTTGHPKGVIMTHENLFDSVERWEVFEIPPLMQYLTFLSPAWAAEQAIGIAMGLMKPLIVNFPEEPETVTRDIREIGAEVLVFGPRQWEMLVSTVQAKIIDAPWFNRLCYKFLMLFGYKRASAEIRGGTLSLYWKPFWALGEFFIFRQLRDRLGLSKTKVAISGSAATSPDVFEFFHAIGVKVRNLYGLTETGWMTAHRRGDIKFGSVGKVLSTSYGTPLGIKISPEGEILIKGGSPFGGYWGKQEDFEKLIENGWFHTGDTGYLDGDGHLVYHDRVSDMKKLSNGHKFPPQYMEARLRYNQYIRDVIAIGDENKQYVSALVDIDFEMVGRWLEKVNIPYSTLTEASQKKEVRALIREAISDLNETLPQQSEIKKFIIFHKPLDPDEGDLTRTRKLRRNFLEARYEGLISSIYKNSDEYEIESEVKYRDGRIGRSKAVIIINSV